MLLKALKLSRQDSQQQQHQDIDEDAYKDYLMGQQEDNEFLKVEGLQQRKECIFLPNNKYLIRFDFVTCTLVFYDCFMVPFKNTFGSEFFSDTSIQVIFFIDSLISLLFTIDLILGFRKAYLDETGTLIKDPKKIAIRYLKFYFWIDLVSAIPFDNFSDSGLLRYISLVKVFRLLRMQKIINSIGYGQSTRAKIRIIQLVVSLLILFHWTTCYFFNITDANHHKLVKQLGHEEAEVFKFNYWLP